MSNIVLAKDTSVATKPGRAVRRCSVSLYTTIFKSFDTFAAPRNNLPASFQDLPANVFWGETHATGRTIKHPLLRSGSGHAVTTLPSLRYIATSFAARPHTIHRLRLQSTAVIVCPFFDTPSSSDPAKQRSASIGRGARDRV